MTSENLHTLGWRQGDVFTLELEGQAASWDTEGGAPAARRLDHDRWLIATQDCNLVRAKSKNNTPTVELRQVLTEEPPATWGVHSRKFLLSEEPAMYLVDDKPSLFVSPRLLANVLLEARMLSLPPGRVLALKTWLGNRYDRPAVPTQLVDLGRAIAAALKHHVTDVNASVREVYMGFDETSEPPRFALTALLEDGSAHQAVRQWLGEAGLDVPPELGVLDEVQAGDASQVSLQVVETLYCADLSQITWEGGPEPDGAV